MTKEMRAIKRQVALESFQSHTLTDPLLRIIGEPKAEWNGGKVTVTLGGKTFDKLTNVTMEQAKLYLDGMAMGIACKLDKDIEAMRKEAKIA